jgi:hypothetical protein
MCGLGHAKPKYGRKFALLTWQNRTEMAAGFDDLGGKLLLDVCEHVIKPCHKCYMLCLQSCQY